MSLTGNWNYPTAIRFGAGRIKELPAICEEFNIKNPLVVTDAGLSKLPIMTQIRDILEQAKITYSVFSDVRPNPGGSDVERGVEVYKKADHDGV